jgi:hypothetical protein
MTPENHSSLNPNDTSARPSANPSSSSTPNSPAAPTSASSQDFASTSSFNTGAKAGIGVGVAIAFLGLVGLAWHCVRRRSIDVPELETVEPEKPIIQEADGNPISELGS